MYARSRSRMVGFGLDFHYRFIRELGKRRSFLSWTKQTPYAVLDNESNGNESLVGGRVCRNPSVSRPLRDASRFFRMPNDREPFEPSGFSPSLVVLFRQHKGEETNPVSFPLRDDFSSVRTIIFNCFISKLNELISFYILIM